QTRHSLSDCGLVGRPQGRPAAWLGGRDHRESAMAGLWYRAEDWRILAPHSLFPTRNPLPTIHDRYSTTRFSRREPRMRLNPPSIFVFLISVLLAALALISKFGAIGINVPRYLPHQEYWLAMVAYMVLMVGNMVRGL